MKNTITITSQGQTTLPVAMRKKLGLNHKSAVLHVRFNDHTNEVVISRPPTIEEVAGILSRYVKPGTPPLIDVHGYYQKHRRATAHGVQ